MAVSQIDPGMNPLVNAGLRFVESCIGGALAVLAVVLRPERHKASGEEIGI